VPKCTSSFHSHPPSKQGLPADEPSYQLCNKQHFSTKNRKCYAPDITVEMKCYEPSVRSLEWPSQNSYKYIQGMEKMTHNNNGNGQKTSKQNENVKEGNLT
jgi:hypothetical protein